MADNVLPGGISPGVGEPAEEGQASVSRTLAGGVEQSEDRAGADRGSDRTWPVEGTVGVASCVPGAAPSLTGGGVGLTGTVLAGTVGLQQPRRDARQGRLESAFRALAPLGGLTLHEAAVVAHSAREAWRRLQQGWHGAGRMARACAGMVRTRFCLWAFRVPCEKCQQRLPAGRLLGYCDRCLAASVPFLRMKVAQLQAEADETLVELGEASRRAYAAEERSDHAERRARDLGAELEALGGELERLTEETEDLARMRRAWKGLFLRMLALALQQHAKAVQRKDSLRAACKRLRWYRAELAGEQARRIRAEAAREGQP